MLDNVFGVPAHPLIVHAAVVLLPMAALATVVVAVVPRLRRAYAPIAFGLALFATIAVALAGSSGESLEKRVEETQLVKDHTHEADMVLPWAIATTLVSAAVVGADRFGDRIERASPRRITAGLGALAVVVAAGATVVIVAVGHSGARAAWHDVPDTGTAVHASAN